MSSESTLILFGFLIVIVPFLGIPSSWYGYIFPIFGLVVFGIGILLRKSTHQRSDTSSRINGTAATTADASSTDTHAEVDTPETPSSNNPSSIA